VLMFATYGRDLVAVARQRNAPLVERLVQRAQAAGQLRADIRQTDIVFIVFVLIEATQLSHAANPDFWRRYLTLILDGMRPGREGVTPLPGPAMLPEEMEKSMRQAGPWPRSRYLTIWPLSGPYSRHPQIELNLHLHVRGVNE